MNTALKRVLKAAGLVLSCVFVLILLVVVWIAVRWDAPPLRVSSSQGSAWIDVSTLGEYPTTVVRIKLSEAESSRLVWELRSDSVAQIHGFTLVSGQNQSQIRADYGKYTVITPRDSTAFLLRGGTKYKIELWGGAGFINKSSAVFTIKER